MLAGRIRRCNDGQYNRSSLIAIQGKSSIITLIWYRIVKLLPGKQIGRRNKESEEVEDI